jgi:hypothetical protein
MAHYDDGTYLPQFDEDGKENKYSQIDRSKLVRFSIGQPRVINGKHRMNILKSIEVDKSTIFWYRRTTAMEIFTANLKEKGRTHFYIAGHDETPELLLDKHGEVVKHPALDNHVPRKTEYEVL